MGLGLSPGIGEAKHPTVLPLFVCVTVAPDRLQAGIRPQSSRYGTHTMKKLDLAPDRLLTTLQPSSRGASQVASSVDVVHTSALPLFPPIFLFI